MVSLSSRILFIFLVVGVIFTLSRDIFAAGEYIPDAQIRHSSTISYTGDGIFYPTVQSTTGVATATSKATYYIKFENDGYMGTPFYISGSGGSSGWTVTYYGQEFGGSDITISITDGTWLTASLGGGGTKIIRMDVQPDVTVEGGTVFPIDIVMSENLTPLSDVVRAETTCTIINKPDIQIKASSAVSYTGNGVYDTTGASQTLSANLNNTLVVSYHIKLENDGNITQQFTVSGTVSAGGWVINYYDAPDNGSDITISITGGSWLSNSLPYAATQEIRVEISPGLGVTGGNVANVYIAMMSSAASDVVKASITCIQNALVEVNYASDNPALSYELNDNQKLSMLQFNIAVPSGNEGVLVNNISLKASGSGLANLDISGVRLIRDSNANGFYDTGETILGGPAVYSGNDTTLVLPLSPPITLPISFSDTWLVVYQMSGSATATQTFILELTAMEIKGQYSLINISVQGLPLASQTKTIGDYTASTTTGVAPLNVAFNGQFGTNGSVVRYEVDFDYDDTTFKPDYQSIFSANTVFRYTTPGGYKARVRITYLDGTVVNNDFVINVDPADGAPALSSVSASPGYVGTAPYAVTLTANASPVSGAITAYLWDFDGNDIIDYVSAISRVNHTYTKAADYYPEVYVQNTLGLTAKRISNRIRVTTSILPPTAVINIPVSDITITTGDCISFSGYGVPGAGGVIAKYEWDFDNDDSFDIVDSALSKPYYTFLYPGAYNVKLRVTETSNVSAEITRTVIVQPSPTPRVIITQAGRYKVNKDALREDVDGKNVTIKVVPICNSRINRIDFRYRLVDFAISDTFTAPADDPFPIDVVYWYPDAITGWATAKLSISTTYPADIRQEYFTATINFRSLAFDNWYEIIALANFNPATNLFDDWNAGQTQTRVFLRNVFTLSPEVQEGTTTAMTDQINRRIVKEQNNSATKNDTTVFIPADGITVFGEPIALTIDTAAAVITPAESGFSTINVFRDIRTDVQSVIKKLVNVKVGYPDTDGNGIVDGTTISEGTLSLCRYDADNSRWVPLLNQSIDYYNKTVSGWTVGWGTFGIIGMLPPEEETISGSSALGVQKDWAFCFIATAAYGTPMAQEVKTLRTFRDQRLLTNPAGRAFVRTYYTVSPPIANFIAKRPYLRYITRQMLRPIVWAVKPCVTDKR
ncbi:MAG: CFI-box-CTERM domain-containing protein [Planctomycetota bacterium]